MVQVNSATAQIILTKSLKIEIIASEDENDYKLNNCLCKHVK